MKRCTHGNVEGIGCDPCRIAQLEAELADARRQAEYWQRKRIDDRKRADGDVEAAIGEVGRAHASEEEAAAMLKGMTRALRKQAAHHHRRQTKMAAERDAAQARGDTAQAEAAELRRQAENEQARACVAEGEVIRLGRELEALAARVPLWRELENLSRRYGAPGGNGIETSRGDEVLRALAALDLKGTP